MSGSYNPFANPVLKRLLQPIHYVGYPDEWKSVRDDFKSSRQTLDRVVNDFFTEDKKSWGTIFSAYNRVRKFVSYDEKSSFFYTLLEGEKSQMLQTFDKLQCYVRERRMQEKLQVAMPFPEDPIRQAAFGNL